MAKYAGRCHCGAVTFEAEFEPGPLTECTCSICRRKGALYQAVADGNLRILTGEGELVLYQFGTGTAHHFFCRTCGIHPFHRPRLDPTRWSVNARCLERFDLDAHPHRVFDGADFEAAQQSLRRSESSADD